MRSEIRNNKKIKLIVVGLFLIVGMTAHAQITLPGGDSNVPDAPINGLVSIGLIVGACLGIKKRIKGIK